MTSPKWALLIGAFALVGAAIVPTSAFADQVYFELERNNEINQEIEQEQEACTNEVEGGLSGEIEQENICAVTQTQTAANVGTILDESENEFDVESILADVGLDL